MSVVTRIGLGTALDVPEMQQLEVRAGRLFAEIGMPLIADHPPPTMEDFESHFDDGSVWVAYAQDREPGVLMGWASASIIDGAGHLDQVSVDPSVQKRGIGTALVGQVCDWASNLGLDAVTLTTFSEVEWNGPFYARRGFVALSDDDLGPELGRIRRSELAQGLDVSPRIAMRLDLRKTRY